MAGLGVRALVAAWARLLLSLPLLIVDSPATAAATVLFLGVAVAAYMIAVHSRAERVVPADRVGAAMTSLASATGLGYAVATAQNGVEDRVPMNTAPDAPTRH